MHGITLKYLFAICIALSVYQEVTGDDVEESTDALKKLIKCALNHVKELSEQCVPKHQEIGKAWLNAANEAKIPVPCAVSDYILKEKLDNCTAETTEKPNSILMKDLINTTLSICLSKSVLQKLDLLENDEFSKTKAEEYIKKKIEEKKQDPALKHFQKCLDAYPTFEGHEKCGPYYKGLECTDIIINHEAVICAIKKCDEYKD